MSPATIHQRLVERALTGKYELFRGLGGGLAILGLILFVMSLRSDEAARAWQLFHVNWLYFTGLAGGSVAFAAVQKITNAKWSGLVIRFAEASVAFLPVSLLGLILIFTLGYHAVYGPMEAAVHGMQHSKEVWLSRPFMFGRLLIGLAVLYWVG
jgi:Ni/Fe-hydrogenase subunit HybB-like protein